MKAARPVGMGKSVVAAARLREVARHTALVFASTLAIHVATFAILAIAALVMETDAFARLSLIVAAVMLASGLFELGLNLTSTKMYGDTRDEAFLRTASLIRLLCVPLGVLMGLVVFAWGAADIGVGIALGAALNVWNGVRANDQARQDYRSFAAASLTFAAIRGLAGLYALDATGDPVLTAVAIYAVPVMGAALSTSSRFMAQAFTGPWGRSRDMLWYAAHVYLNALAFIAIPYVPQFVIASRLDATAVGTYGLILTFCGPISLLVYSLRSVLLPKMLGEGAKFEDRMWSWHGLLTIIAISTVLMAGGALLAHGLGGFYGHKFPEIRSGFLVFFAGFTATALMGLYSLSVHTLGVPHISTGVGLAKLAVLLGVLSVTGTTLGDVVMLTAIVMVAGEIVLVALLATRRYGMAA